ncbi:hypothetical protein K438DRAFT_1936433 [Mycena galopus ATCC 62051]|nr:hypothetical protein K438DRAFT_1936433 [Mycena galopus ATCC 62051]
MIGQGPPTSTHVNRLCRRGLGMFNAVVLDELRYVAKRCYEITRGQVSVTENRDKLVKEWITLRRKIEVKDFILAREGITGESNEGSEKSCFIPSPASGIINSGAMEHTVQEVFGYTGASAVHTAFRGLIDTRVRTRADPVRTRVGTMSAPCRPGADPRPHRVGTCPHTCVDQARERSDSDEQAAAINAVQHFVYPNSNKSLVLADIQPSESQNSASKISANKASVPFDLVSHTLAWRVLFIRSYNISDLTCFKK